MYEAYLHHIWKHQKFDSNALRTDAGEKVEVLKPGIHNHNAGPDFLHARLRIGGIEMIGHVEIHLRSRDWYVHQHQLDQAYNPVVLHVVYERDKEVLRPDGSTIPQLELKGSLDEMPLWRYEQWMQERSWIPCATHIHRWQPDKVRWWLNRMAVEKLENRWQQWQQALQNGEELEQLAWITWAKALGGTVNQEAFETLAQSLHWKWVWKAASRGPLELDALLFGMAALLPEKVVEPYETALWKSWGEWENRGLKASMSSVQWRFARMRPSGFPTRRLAQLSAWIYQSQAGSFTQMQIPQKAPDLPSYWKKRYRFGLARQGIAQSGWGKDFTLQLRLNAAIPLQFALMQIQTSDEAFALDTMNALPPEDNKIIRQFNAGGFKPRNALESQGLLHMKKTYCDQKACWTCTIGQYLLIS